MGRPSPLLLALLGASSLALGAAPKKKKAPPAPPPPVTSPTPRVREHLSDRTLELLEVAEHVQPFEVRDTGGLRPDPARAIASDFERGDGGRELDAKELGRLRAVFYDEKSYRFAQDVARCRFLPQLSFQLQAGIDTLEALVSFSCNQVLFVVGKPGGRWIPHGTFDVKPARKQLLELARATLPTSPSIAALK